MLTYCQYDPLRWTVQIIYLFEDRILVASRKELRSYDLSSAVIGSLQPVWSKSLRSCHCETPKLVRIASNSDSATCVVLHDDKLLNVKLFSDSCKEDISFSYLPIDYSMSLRGHELTCGSGAVVIQDRIVLFTHRMGAPSTELNILQHTSLLIEDMLPPPYQHHRWSVARLSLDLLSGLIMIQGRIRPPARPWATYATRLYKLW
jgi:hypothetical protein